MTNQSLVCIDDGVPEETVRLIREACEKRTVDFIHVHPAAFDYRPEHQLQPGTLLYRPAVSMQAWRVEQFLYGEGVATFYRSSDDLFNDCSNPTLRYQRAGLPVPRTFPCFTTDRDLLRDFVERLGGFPVILKVQGYSGGLGVMRIESYPSLFSLVEYLHANSTVPLLMAYIPDATHWRLVVVGDDVVASYINPEDEDDFRTYGSDDLADYTAEPIEAMKTVAIQATHLMGHDHGGVDILMHPSGRFYLLESNFPCYFPQAQLVAGIDIAGRMVDYLLAKAERLTAHMT